MTTIRRLPFFGTKLSGMFRIGLSNLLTVGITVFMLAGCSGNAENNQGPKPAPVTAHIALKKDVPVVLKAIGTVEPHNTVAVRARVAGEITRIAFKEGQDVSQGDLLFTIDPRPYQAALEGALAELDRDNARLKSAKEDVRRYAELVKKDYVTSQAYDQTIANADALKATVAADQAAVQSARVNLDYCTVRAPITGRTGNLLVKLGNVIKAEDQPVVTINQITPINVSFSVPEEYLADIRRYAADGTLDVEAAFPDQKVPNFRGELSFINNTVDGSTGTILLKATFPNPDKTLWPGQFVNVILRLATSRSAVVVPSQAVQRGQQGDYVYVVKGDMSVDSRTVKLGQRLDGETVIRKGIEAGEQVVTDGQLRLFPGAKVALMNQPASKGANNP
ncbi:MAG: efflux RND transporter periplasmic adaptor subunit [Desulfobacterales bacterium]|jgi:multidrug efflux system membrane fusion protein|nr:efflux RND transporter periplasmic adaptor subunit [Desulfobacterales bacterium]